MISPGKSAFELWRDLPGNADKTIDDFMAYLQAKSLRVVIVALEGIRPEVAPPDVTYRLLFAQHGLAMVANAQLGEWDGETFKVDSEMQVSYKANGDVDVTSSIQWSRGFVRLVGV